MQTDTSNQKNNDISLKRYAARVAMEGPEEKARREAEEKILRDKELLAESIKRKEADKKAAEEKALRDKELEAERQKVSTAQSKEEIKKEIDAIKSSGTKPGTIRTLKGDMNELIREQNVSIARIAMQEDSRRRQGENLENKNKSNRSVIVVVTSILIISGSLIASYFYFTTLEKSPPEGAVVSTPLKERNLIEYERRSKISLSGMPIDKILPNITEEITGASVPNGNVQKISLTKKNSSGNDEEISSSEFFDIIKSSPPGDLTRSLEGGINLLVSNTVIGARSALLIMTIDSYQNAFAGMLKWEKTSLVKDLLKIVAVDQVGDDLYTQEFQDLVINNQDARILKNQTGDIVMIYGFPDTKKLIVAGKPEVFIDTIERLKI